MSLVAKLLTPAHIALDLQLSSKKRLFEQAGLLFENQDGVARSLVFDSLFARERLGSTGLGQGVAIPHGRIKGLKAPMAAVFQLAQPIGFDAPDNEVTIVTAGGDSDSARDRAESDDNRADHAHGHGRSPAARLRAPEGRGVE